MDLAIQHWISQYGYAGIFFLLMSGIIGLPIPDETLMIFLGYLVFKGELAIVPTIASAFLGSICGITFSYVLGRTGGHYLITKYSRFFHITQERINGVHDWLERTGKWGLLFGYFIPGVRHLVSLVAGTSQLKYRVFAILTYAGGLIWSVSFVSAGFFLGEGWQKFSASFQRWILIGSITFVGFALILFAIYRWRSEIE